MSIPNMQAEVERIKDAHPQAWKDAHTGNARTEDFIRILAANLHEVNPNFGLNGKRGDPNDISDDAINFIGEGPGHDPTTGKPVTVFDVIRGAGGPNPMPSWDRIDLAGPGAWVKPGAAVPLPPVPPPAPKVPSYEDLGGDAFFRDRIGKPLQEDMAAAGQALNDGSSVWFSRTIYSVIAAKLKDPTADPAPIIKKHRNEWRAILGQAPL